MATLYAAQYTNTITPTNRLSEGYLHRGNVIVLRDSYTAPAGVATSGSTIDFFVVPANAVFLLGWMDSTATGAAGETMKLGLFGLDDATTYDGTNANDDDFFNAAIRVDSLFATFPTFFGLGASGPSKGYKFTRPALVRGTTAGATMATGQVVGVTFILGME